MHVPQDDYSPRDLWLTRLYYLIMIGGGGFIFPFINIFYVRQGLNGEQVGWVVAFSSLVALFAAPAWAEWNARRGRLRMVLASGLILSAAGMMWLSAQYTFAGILLVTGLRVLANAGVSPLSDALAVRVTGATRSGFGSVRVWGSAGWAVLALLGGFLIQRTSIQAGFLGYAVFMVASAVVLYSIHDPKPGASGPPAPAKFGFGKVARDLMSSRVLAGLALMLIITGLANNGVAQFENVYLDQLGAKEGLIGVAGMASAVVEVPAMFWADSMVRRHGSVRMLLVGLLITALLRALVLAFPSVTSILIQRGVGGLGFSLIIVAEIKYISQYTRPEDTPAAMALFSVSIASLIGIVGTPLSGLAFDHIGARWLYAVSAGGYGLGLLVLKLAQGGRPKDAAG